MTEENDELENDGLEIEKFDVVPQSVLMEYLRLQNRSAFLKESIRASLEAGAKVEPGDITAKLSKSMRGTPKWKEELQKIVGADKIKEIMDSTEKTEVVSLKVDVKKNAVIGKADLT